MKRQVSIVLSCLICITMIWSTVSGFNAVVAYELNWEIFQITDNAFADENPVILLDTENNIHVAWAGGTYFTNETIYGDQEIFYAVKTVEGSWEISQLTENDVDDLFPDLVVDSNGTAHLVWSSEISDWNNEICYATNSEGSWQTITVTQDNANDVRPSLALDSSDMLHIAWQRWSGESWDIFYGTWDEESWNIEQVTEKLIDCFSPSLVLDAFNTPYIAWWEQPDKLQSAEIFYGVKTTYGWNSYQVTMNMFGDWDPILVLDSHQRPHMVWIGNTGSNNNDVYYATRESACACQPIQITQVTTHEDPEENPQLFLGSDNTPHIAWERKGKIYYAIRVSMTEVWEDIQITTGHNPWLFVDHIGEVHLVYFDTPRDKKEPEIFYATTQHPTSVETQITSPKTLTTSPTPSVGEFMLSLESIILVFILLLFLEQKKLK